MSSPLSTPLTNCADKFRTNSRNLTICHLTFHDWSPSDILVLTFHHMFHHPTPEISPQLITVHPSSSTNSPLPTTWANKFRRNTHQLTTSQLRFHDWSTSDIQVFTIQHTFHHPTPEISSQIIIYHLLTSPTSTLLTIWPDKIRTNSHLFPTWHLTFHDWSPSDIQVFKFHNMFHLPTSGISRPLISYLPLSSPISLLVTTWAHKFRTKSHLLTTCQFSFHRSSAPDISDFTFQNMLHHPTSEISPTYTSDFSTSHKFSQFDLTDITPTPIS